MKSNAIVSNNGYHDDEIDMSIGDGSTDGVWGRFQILTLVAVAKFDLDLLKNWKETTTYKNMDYTFFADAYLSDRDWLKEEPSRNQDEEKKADAWMSDRDWLKEHSRNQKEEEEKYDEPNDEELTPSQIGVTLRDSFGIPQVSNVTCSKILRILRTNGIAPDYPEDLYCLIKEAVSIRKHLDINRKGKDTKSEDEEPNCDLLHDSMSIEWGNFRDCSDELTVEVFAETVENKDDYTRCYEKFDKYLKHDVHEDSTNGTKIAELLRFHATKSGDELIWLKEFADCMKEGRDDLYCITGENIAATSFSPFLETLRKGPEMLRITNPIDEYAVQQLRKFDEQKG